MCIYIFKTNYTPSYPYKRGWGGDLPVHTGFEQFIICATSNKGKHVLISRSPSVLSYRDCFTSMHVCQHRWHHVGTDEDLSGPHITKMNWLYSNKQDQSTFEGQKRFLFRPISNPINLRRLRLGLNHHFVG